MRRKIMMVIQKQDAQLQSSISKFGQLEAKALSEKYDVTIAGTKEDWQLENVQYTNTPFTVRDYDLTWSENWQVLAKYVKNDTIFYFHSPYAMLEMYNRTFVRRFVFPKFIIRYHANLLQEFMPGPKMGVHIAPSLYFPSIFGSQGGLNAFKEGHLKCGCIVRNDEKRPWLIHHPIYIECDEIDGARIQEEEFPAIQLAAFHMNPAIARPDRLIEVMDALYAMGVKFKVTLNIADEYGADEIKTKPYLIYNNRPIRENYYPEIKGRHIFLCFNASHSGGVTFLEMLYAGMVGIFWDATYVHEKLPNYPFVAKNKQEAITMIKYVIENYAEAKKRIEPFVSFIKENHSQVKWKEKLWENMTKIEKVLFPKELK